MRGSLVLLFLAGAGAKNYFSDPDLTSKIARLETTQPIRTKDAPLDLAGKEGKHAPIVALAAVSDGSALEVSIPHGMSEDHKIDMIWVKDGHGTLIGAVELTADMEPKLTMDLPPGITRVTVFESCNLHGVWASSLNLPGGFKLEYFDIRGRAEPIRLALAAAGQDWEEVTTDREVMSSTRGSVTYPWGQVPILETETGVRIAQMDAILRFVGRSFDLYGSGTEEAAAIDSLLGGVEDMRKAYGTLKYDHNFSDDAKEAFETKHMDASTTQARNGGAHFAYMEAWLERKGHVPDAGIFAVGGRLSIADIQLFDIVDLHQGPSAFPGFLDKHNLNHLKAHYEAVSKLPGIAAYLASPKRRAS